MTAQEIEKLIDDLKKELAYYFDLYKDAGVGTAGDIMNKIKQTDRKIAELQNMKTIKTTATAIEKQYDISILVQQNKITEALDCILHNKQKTDIHNTCILLKSQYNDIESERNQNLISFDEYKREKARIVKAILNL